MTFYSCSVGFMTQMLFDERKNPYHLMLQKFMQCKGLEAYFNTFYWALTQGGKVPIEQGLEHPDLPEATGEFLDAWLMLLEKMVNPKTVFESPHTMASKPSATSPGFVPFDPVKYLIKIHKKAFECLTHLWDRKPLPGVYGERMSESILAILCHLLRGETIIKEKLNKEKESASSRTSNIPPTAPGREGLASVAAAATPRNELEEQGINPDHLQQLTDMGFARELAIEALLATNTLEQATDYLLSHPGLPARATGQAVSCGF